MDIEETLDREIDIIENDESLTNDEKRERIIELEREAREYYEDEQHRDYLGIED